ncbi:DUF4262 domain-containing protein [Vibrio owensii]|uniref:DUF4262 domain-containing protein n=1 Tax=Vibrio owensii TaxID=696485 RepID=UPI003393FA9D
MKCNCPSPEELYPIIKQNIEKTGFHMFMIQGEVPFFYTVGFIEHGLPELVCTVPVRPDLMHTIFWNVYHSWKEHGYKEGENYEIIEGMVKFVTVDPDAALADYTIQAGVYYRDTEYDGKHTAVQMLLPDVNGLFPNEPGYDMQQPLIKTLTVN